MSYYDAALERLNWAHDHRNIERDKPPVLYTQDEEGNDIEVELPTTWAVCPTCDGEGKHVNPAIDCGGLTREDFEEDPDFAEEYMSGMYDVPCNHCGGRTTVREVDWDRLSPEEAEAYRRQLQEEADYRRMERMEYILGC